MMLFCFVFFFFIFFFFFSSRRRHTRLTCDWSSDVCSSDLGNPMKGCPCRKSLDGLLEPPLGPAGTDHAGATVTTLVTGSVASAITRCTRWQSWLGLQSAQ